jgi:hypothetical protein
MIICLQIDRQREKANLEFFRYENDKPLIASSEISASQIVEFRRLMEAFDFWNQPTERPVHGLDGESVLFEGRTADRYHAIDRWSPSGDEFSKICEFLNALSRGIDSPNNAGAE